MSKSNETTPNVPTLRFKSFEQEWAYSTIGKCSMSLEYGMNAAAVKYDGKHKYIRITDIDEETSAFIPNPLSSPDGEFEQKYLVKENDILFARTGASVGKSYLYNPNDGELYFAGFLIRARIKPEYNGTFIYYQTKSKKYNRWVKLTSMRSGQPGINSQEYSGYPIAITGKVEQDKIADFFQVIDNRIAVQNKIISDLKVLKKELCRKMLSSIAEYKPLGELCSITTGKLDANANNQNGLYPFFTCGKDTLSIDNYAFDGEAILIAGNGDIGHTKYYYGKFNAYQRTYVLMGFKADAQFVKMGIDTYLPQKISEETQGGAMPYIKLSTLTSLKIPFTTEEKQLSIRNHYDTIAQKVENETKMLDLLLQQKSYFLNAMLI